MAVRRIGCTRHDVRVTHHHEDVGEHTVSERSDALESLRPEARTVAAGLRVTSSVLAVPAISVAVGALVGFLVVAVLAVVALADGGSVLRWVVLAFAVAGAAVTVLFLLRVRLTYRASRDEHALADDLLGMVDLEALTTAVLTDLAELTSVEGGLRAVSRARALWRVLRRLDVTEHVGSFERARWFVPPELATTWLLAQVVTWGGLVAWVLVPIVGGVVLAGWL